MIDKIYLEITNACNLDCSFCHKTSRPLALMTEQQFDTLTSRLQGHAKFLYFHLMGEPTLHPLLPRFIEQAKARGFLPMLTTNGSTLHRTGDALLSSLPYKISISLHAPEANAAFSDENYLTQCIDFARRASSRGCIVALRLWNLGTDSDNSPILDRLHAEFPSDWGKVRGGSSLRLSDKLFLEWGERFDWPDINAPESPTDADLFCYGLRDQIGVLVDGTVVPCCLDADGALALGNLFDSELDSILHSPRAVAIYEGFTCRRAVEKLCRTCGYAKRFSRD